MVKTIFVLETLWNYVRAVDNLPSLETIRWGVYFNF